MRFLRIIALVVALGVVQGCGSGDSTDSVSVAIGIVTPAEKAVGKFDNEISPADVTAIRVTVYDAAGNSLDNIELGHDSGRWSGYFRKLPTKEVLRFVALAFGSYLGADGQPVELYRGSVESRLSTESNQIEINLWTGSLIDGNDFPDFTLVYPAEIKIDETVVVELHALDSHADFLFVEVVDVESGQVVFKDMSSRLDDGAVSLEFDYTAPSVAGTRNLSVTLSTDRGAAVRKFFALRAVNEHPNSLTVNFAPVITSITIEESDAGLVFKAMISDDSSEGDLVLQWSTSSDASFVDANANPTELTGVNASEGIVELSVTDVDGAETRLAINISERDFSSPVTYLVSSGIALADLVVNHDGVIEHEAAHYKTVLIANGSTVDFLGDVYAREIVVVNGTMIVEGNVNVTGEIRLAPGTADQANRFVGRGSTHSADAIFVGDGSVAELSGHWVASSVLVSQGGEIQVNRHDVTYPGSGMLTIATDELTVETGALISADGAGADPRGKGGDWYGNATGGSFCGQGGRGFWASSAAVANAYGIPYLREISMGAQGGYHGGGAVDIRASRQLSIAGEISADGEGRSGGTGGGSGGGVLLQAPMIALAGQISAVGGIGGNGSSDYGGGGGGGCLKLFYLAGISVDIMPQLDVSGGRRGGYRNTAAGQAGAVWLNAIPAIPDGLAPAAMASVSGMPTFEFRVRDASVASDGRDDDLFAEIEIRADDITQHRLAFDQSIDLTGFSSLSYRDGDVASFTVPMALDPGTYYWRVRVRDRSLFGEWSQPESFVVE